MTRTSRLIVSSDVKESNIGYCGATGISAILHNEIAHAVRLAVRQSIRTRIEKDKKSHILRILCHLCTLITRLLTNVFFGSKQTEKSPKLPQSTSMHNVNWNQLQMAKRRRRLSVPIKATTTTLNTVGEDWRAVDISGNSNSELPIQRWALQNEYIYVYMYAKRSERSNDQKRENDEEEIECVIKRQNEIEEGILDPYSIYT